MPELSELTLGQQAGIAAIIAIVGALLGWILGRAGNTTRPLNRLARSAIQMQKTIEKIEKKLGNTN